ncbi:7-cyano-7-deazaguanine synthase QueC [bacterium]|nr:7-cyano-7-deazaguanine synthase QueC [bacterium]
MAQASKRAVVLLSGGLDSSVAMALALRDGVKICRAITYDYGQRAATREIQTAERICYHYKVLHSVVPLPWFRELWSGGALLTESAAIPHPSFSDLTDKAQSLESARKVWVPNRNGVFLEIAAGMAESRGADSVVVGFNREEAETFPDNSVEYLQALTRALSYSTANGVTLLSPTALMDKNEIVRAALDTGFPLSLVWSCYEGFESMCGECESCMRLRRALMQNGATEKVRFANLLT